MTLERFIQLIENPELLSTIPYEELKTMAFAYPYAHNLRYLLALKAQQEDHPQFKRNVATAAAYSIDRSRLLALIAPKIIAPQAIPMLEREEMLELRPIETVKRELEALTPVKRSEEKEAQQAPLEISGTSMIATKTVAEIPGTAPEPTEQPEAPQTTSVNQNQAVDTAVQPANNESASENPDFHTWISQFHPPVLRAARPRHPQRAAPEQTAAEKPVQARTAQQLAEKSVSENKEILSETLARLYAQQGYRDKAIAMYMRLGLAFPEKSAYFAAEIEKLKK